MIINEFKRNNIFQGFIIANFNSGKIDKDTDIWFNEIILHIDIRLKQFCENFIILNPNIGEYIVNELGLSHIISKNSSNKTYEFDDVFKIDYKNTKIVDLFVESRIKMNIIIDKTKIS